MELYPLKFDPILKERIWGGTKLRDVLGKSITDEHTGESWEISAVDGDVSVVANGVHRGTSLSRLIEDSAEDLLGQSVVERFGKDFPILIKFIDAKKDLSVQLHPHDELARERHQSFGKTEMWYIMDADPGANLIVGFNRDLDKQTYKEYLQNDRLLELLNYEQVKEGDTFFINTGKVHAIGAGVLLAEIQQTSDITYRIYDFKRKDKNGNYRELHTELALDAIDYRKKDDFRVNYSQQPDAVNSMVNSPYFKTNFLHLNRDFALDLNERDAFTILMCVQGEASVTYKSESVSLQRGETVLLPAAIPGVTLETAGAKLLEVTI
ncbi:type I phosphomannose isomerase catalytic subunit [Zeaxanthinibacter enoshimensis]|uniref:type I phosphomannose isomerase catalytic subunit n=1 Tax=Zeaxanthinibacter enoshimensis TaxID=392009 RepID=UPI003567F757